MLSFHITLTKGQLKAKLQLLPCANPKILLKFLEEILNNQKDLEPLLQMIRKDYTKKERYFTWPARDLNCDLSYSSFYIYD